MKWFITACLFLPLLCRIESTEDIMTEGKVGDDIVKRVLDVLKPYNIPLDRKCFQELAVLRSNNGVPYIAGEGGIWRVNISQLTDAQTACQISLLNQCSISKILTGEDFSSFDIADLDKPLYSALAMIFYALSLNNSIPLQDKDYVEYCKLCIKSNGTSTEPLKPSNQEFKNKIASISKKSCTIENADAGRFYFAHPDPTKYIQCTEYGTYYEMPCAPGTIWSQTAYTCVIDNDNPVDGPNTETTTETKTTTPCTILKNNPCTKENIHDGKFYFSHPDPTKFIQCTVWGIYYEMPCAPGTIWSQIAYTCIRNSGIKMTKDTTQIPTETKSTISRTILKNNPCTKENIDAGKFYFAHPDPTKFIQCTAWGTYYEMPCAPGTIWSQTVYTCIRNSGNKMTKDTTQIPTETKSTISRTILKHNPCTKENIDAGKFYFAHPDPTKFIQCTAWGTYYEMPCAPGTIWSQTVYTCIRNSGNKMTKDTTQIPTETKSTISRTILKHNPCTKENIDAGKFYFAHPDPTKFIQCTVWGTYYEMPCAPGTTWSQTVYTCIRNSRNKMTEDTTQIPTETKTTTPCTILKNNPCTKENIHIGKFYFSHPDPTKFIQCTTWGTYYEMPCAPGTIWSQTAYTCIRNSGNKMTEYTTQIPTETKTTTPCNILKHNPCTKENIDAGKFYFAHPDPTKFIQCTVWGTYYEMPCAPGTTWSQTVYTCIRNSRNKMTEDTTQIPTETKTTTPCTILKNNPCTKENIDAGKFYFSHPDPTKFIQCTTWGTYYEMPCAPGTIWSQTAYTCIRNSGDKMTEDTTQIPTETKTTNPCTILKHNPCTKENIDAGKFYFAHPDPTKFIQCTAWGTYYEMPCAPGTIWSQTAYTCIRNSGNKMTKDTTQIPTETKSTISRTILKHNPCTKENIDAGKFYFSHPDPTKFIQCTTWGTYYEMPCAPSTIWSQTAYTCIRNSGNKMTEDTTQIPTERIQTTLFTLLNDNPCTKENIDAGKFYFSHPDPTKFIQCTARGTYYEMPCAPGTIWSQTAYTCIRNSGNKMTEDTTQIPTETKSTISRTILKHNPCTKENIDAGKFYFAHPDPTKFIQCTVWGTYYEMPCAPGTTWSQTVYTCIRNSRNKMTEDTTQIPTETKTTTPCTILKNNPCTKENIHIGKFYFSHPDPTKFIQCTTWGTYYEMPCAPGTIWSQTAYTCIRNSGNKMTEYTTQIPTETKTTTPCNILKHNPCTKENIDAGKFYFAHPDPTKFIQCTVWGTYYEMPCAPGTTWSQTVYTCIRNSRNKMTEDTTQIPTETKTTTPCTILKNNPCTKENIDAGKFYFSHPDPTKFIQCTTWGTYYEMPCAPGTIWSQTAYTCIRNSGDKMTEDTTQIPTETKTTNPCTILKHNPCTKENIDAGKFYFAHPDPTKFIQCTAWGTYYEMPCAPGTIWSQTAYTCIRNSGNKMTKDTTQIPTETKSTISRTILKHNPCTKENIDAGKFYFSHPDPTKFIQCTTWGTYYEMPCAPSTIWSQTAYTCIRNSGNKMTEDTTQIPTERIQTTLFTLLNDNPCTKENIDAGKFYFSHPDPTKFIQCTARGTYYEMPCAPGTIWSQTAYTCIRNSGNKMTEDTTQIPTETKTTISRTILKHNPCTKENIDAGKFYFVHPDPTKFIQCTAWGTYYEMPCAPGTIWSQIAYTCVHTFVECNSRQVTIEPSKTSLPFPSTFKWVTRGGLS